MILPILLSLLSLFVFPEQTPSLVSQPVSVILDTDMDSDVDDVGALAMLHTYEKQGKARLLGVIVTSDDTYSAPCTDAINRWFGRGDLPIGVSQKDSLKSFSRYTKQIAEQFPNRYSTNADVEDCTVVYRRLLASAPDQSVVIITIGHLTSFSRLLQSPPDSLSPLTGQELVRRKVLKWSCMGGQYPSGKEANFYRPDPASTVTSLDLWKKPVVFAGWEVGEKIVTGGKEFQEQADVKSPVYKAYELFNNFQGRASWDQISVLEAIEGHAPFFELVQDGHCQVAADGSNQWIIPVNPMHGYLRIKAPFEAIRTYIDSLMLGK